MTKNDVYDVTLRMFVVSGCAETIDTIVGSVKVE